MYSFIPREVDERNISPKTKSPNFIEISLHTQGQEEKFDNPPLDFIIEISTKVTSLEI